MPDKMPLNIELKLINRSKIYHQFLCHAELTKQDLFDLLHISLPTIAKNVDNLVEEGLVRIVGAQGNTGGRKAVLYSVVNDARVAFGVDITKYHFSLVAVDVCGNIIAYNRQHERFESTDRYYKLISEELASIVRRIGASSEQILGVGIGIPALVEENHKTIFYSKIMDISPDLYDGLKKYIPYEIKLFNDAKAAIYSETWTIKNVDNLFYLLLGNNVGGSMIINGTKYYGNSFRHGEIGHVRLVPDGKLCYCGQRGCVDPYLAATTLSMYTDGDLELFFEKLRTGDPELIMVWNNYMNDLAAAVNTIHTLVDCHVIIGGYIGEYIAPYIEDLKNRVGKLYSFTDEVDYISAGSYKKESIAAGAALTFIEQFVESI